MSHQELNIWQRQLLAETAAARGAAVPLRPLLERLAGLRPQQRFECLQWLLERAGLEVVRGEGEYRLVKGRPGPLSLGEWAELAAAVAEAEPDRVSVQADPGEESSVQSSPYTSFPFRFRSVEIFSRQSRDYRWA
jgi:hypothetical protein